MTIKKQLTCRTYLESLDGPTIVARFDSDNGTNKLVIEPGSTYTTNGPYGAKIAHKLISDRHYLVGEIADSLYAYEQLGYTPDELRLILMDYKVRKAGDLVRDGLRDGLKSIYITTGRSGGKTEFQRKIDEWSYIDTDIAYAQAMAAIGDFKLRKNTSWPALSNTISNVIFNDPATIVFWADGTKTVVKAQDEAFDPEKGLAMAICKKVFGNEGNYFNQIKKWTEKYEADKIAIEPPITSVADGCARAANSLKKLANALRAKENENGH